MLMATMKCTSSMNEKWNLAPEAKTKARDVTIDCHNASFRNASIPKRNPKVIVLKLDDDELSQDSTIAATVESEKKKRIIKRKKKTSNESIEEKATREEKAPTLRRTRSKERQSRMDGRRGKSSEGRQSSRNEGVSTNKSDTTGMIRLQNEDSAEWPVRSRSKDSYKDCQSSKKSRPRSREGRRPTRATSYDGGSSRSIPKKEIACTNETKKRSANEESIATPSVSMSKYNDEVRKGRSRAPFLRINQQEPAHEGTPPHLRSQERVSGSRRWSGNAADASVKATPEPRRCLSLREHTESTSAAKKKSSIRRMPKGALDAILCPISVSKDDSVSRTPALSTNILKSTYKPNSSSSRTSATTQLTMEEASIDFDGTVSMSSLYEAKPASERTTSSHGSLPLKGPSHPGDPPAKRPARYRRVKPLTRGHQQAPPPRPVFIKSESDRPKDALSIGTSGRQQAPPPRPVFVKSESNRFLEVGKDASSTIPAVPRRVQSPITVKKQNLSKSGGDNSLPKSNKGKIVQNILPQTCDSFDPESKSLYANTNNVQRAVLSPSSDALLGQPRKTYASRTVDPDSKRNAKILNFNVEEWNTDDENECKQEREAKTRKTSKQKKLAGKDVSGKKPCTSRRPQ